jgi:hypothetical protein
MSDVILLATIMAFFLLAALLVRACGRITSASLEDMEAQEGAGSGQEADRPT